MPLKMRTGLMQISYSSFEQGEVVVVDLLFSNLEGSKIRPVLVISSTEYNKYEADVVVLKITSQQKQTPFTVSLTNKALVRGELKVESSIKTDFPLAIEKSKIIRRIGMVEPATIMKVKENLRRVFDL